MERNIESRASQTILQRPEQIKIGERTYEVAPPSVATIILASEIVAQLPAVNLDDDKVVEETLSIAKDCRRLGDLAAVLILGAKHINDKVERKETSRKRGLRGLFHKMRTGVSTESAKEALSRELLENVAPRDLYNAIAKIISMMQVGDFFGLTTFLTGINLMRPTKVEPEVTASGQ